MTARRPAPRSAVVLDRALERLPLFRLSDSAADEGALQYAPAPGARWRVLPAPGDRLPGTFDQDVYVGLLHRWSEAGRPDDGVVTFTLHALLRALGRKADGRTYAQLRHALARLERTTLETTAGAYRSAAVDDGRQAARFTVLSSVVIERRRVAAAAGAEQLALFPEFDSNDPGDARVVLAPPLRANLAAGRHTELSWACYQRLASPVARRLYRLLAALDPDEGAAALGSEAEGGGEGGGWTDDGRWRAPLERWAERLPLAQRYPSHLQRVLAPAHDMLVAAELLRSAAFVQAGRTWWVEYAPAPALARDAAARR
jgi:plasmid replication initiation protein